jgi:hypothetical protein
MLPISPAVARTRVEDLCSDIWQYILEYFNAFEISTSLSDVTMAANKVIFSDRHPYLLRGLTLHTSVHSLPKSFDLNRVISLNLHQNFGLHVIDQFLQLRALAMTGNSEWIIQVLQTLSQKKINLVKLTITTPGISSLQHLLISIGPLSSLKRLEIYANEDDERPTIDRSLLQRTELQHFTLHSCSPVYWDDISHILSLFSSLQSFDITLFHKPMNPNPSFTFLHLHHIHFRLNEVPFDKLLLILSRMPLLVKVKLSGLVDGPGFVVVPKWFLLFESSPSLSILSVCVSLQEATHSFHDAEIHRQLRDIGLHLKCFDHDIHDLYNAANQQLWWNLSGTIIKQVDYSNRNKSVFTDKK